MNILLGDLMLELVQDYQGQIDNSLPDSPVERGETLTDHIQKDPDLYTFLVRITPDYIPIGTVGTEDGEVTTEGLAEFLQEQKRTPAEKTQEIKEKLNRLIDYRDNKKIFRLVTPERVVEKAAILNINYTKTAELQYVVTLAIREIHVIEPEDTGVEGDEANAGKRSDEELSEDELEEAIDREYFSFLKADFSGLFADTIDFIRGLLP